MVILICYEMSLIIPLKCEKVFQYRKWKAKISVFVNGDSL